MGMSRNLLPRFVTTLSVTVYVAANSEDEANDRMDGVAEYVSQRLSKSTFERLPGRPKADYIEWGDLALHGYDVDRGVALVDGVVA